MSSSIVLYINNKIKGEVCLNATYPIGSHPGDLQGQYGLKVFPCFFLLNSLIISIHYATFSVLFPFFRKQCPWRSK
jgi:hypothetical protein